MPRQVSLLKMDLMELKELRNRINIAIVSAEKAARKKALEDAQRAAQRHGFSLHELVSDGSKQGGTLKVSAKYCNPENTSNTWSGRGRQPEWFKAAIAAGISREEMEI